MTEESPKGESRKEKKALSRSERGGFLASWLSKNQVSDSILDANERKDEKDHEAGGARGRFKLAWGRMFGKIGATEEVIAPMPREKAVRESTKQLGSLLAEKEKANTVDALEQLSNLPVEPEKPDSLGSATETIAPVSDEYKGELRVAHSEETVEEIITPAEENKEYSLGLRTAPLLPGTTATSAEQKRREYLAKPAITKTASSANTEAAVAKLRQEGFIKPVEKTQTPSTQPEVVKNTTGPETDALLERTYELSHEAKDQDSHATSGAVQLGDILASYPKTPPKSKPEPISVPASPYTPEPIDDKVWEPIRPFNPRPGSMASESLSLPSSLANPVTIMPPSDKPVVEPPSPLWQTPEPMPEPDKYRQAVANGFWGGIIVVFLMAVFYLFT